MATTRSAKKQAAAEKTNTQAAEEAAAKATSNVRSDEGYYVSRNPETVVFGVMVQGVDIKPGWDKKRERLVWRVPAELIERFEAHTHFVSGRIVRARK